MGAVTGPKDCYQSTHSPKNPAYEFPRTGLKPFKALLREPAMLTVFPHCLRDPHLKTTYTSVGFPRVYGVPLNRVWNCARRRHPPLLQSIYSNGHRSKSLSRRKTSRTSAHFRAGHKTRIHSITEWLSLLPTSHTRTSVGSPYGLLSLDRETYGVATFRILSIVGLGACCRPGGSMVHDAARYRRHSRLHCLLAQASQPLWLVLYHDLYRRFTLVHLAEYLAL